MLTWNTQHGDEVIFIPFHAHSLGLFYRVLPPVHHLYDARDNSIDTQLLKFLMEVSPKVS